MSDILFRVQMKRHLRFGDLLEALKEVNRQPSNGLNFIRQPSKMQINRQRVSRYFKSPNFSLSLDLGS